MTTRIWLSAMAASSWSRSLKVGSDSRCSMMDSVVARPYVTFFPIVSLRHVGASSTFPRPMLRISAARWRSPGLAMGSSQLRLRSAGMTSMASAFCCSRSSRRSLDSADCVSAARCREPSGFFTTLMGDSSADWAV